MKRLLDNIAKFATENKTGTEFTTVSLKSAMTEESMEGTAAEFSQDDEMTNEHFLDEFVGIAGGIEGKASAKDLIAAGNAASFNNPLATMTDTEFTEEAFDNHADPKYTILAVAAAASLRTKPTVLNNIFPVVITHNGIIELSVERHEVFQYASHAELLKGNYTRVSALDVWADPAALEGNDTIVVPSVGTTAPVIAERAKYFIDDTFVSTHDEEQVGGAVTTNYLKVGEEIPLMGIGSLPGMVAGSASRNTNLSINQHMGDMVLLASGLVGGTATKEAFVIPITTFDNLRFYRARNGKNSDLTLDATSVTVKIGYGQDTRDGVASEIFSALIGDLKTAELTFRVSGTLSTESGSVYISTTKPKLARIYNAAGTVPSTDASYADLQTLIDGLSTFAVDGFKIPAKISNTSFSQVGTLIGSSYLKTTHGLSAHNPITIPLPFDDAGNLAPSSLADKMHTFIKMYEAKVHGSGMAALRRASDLLHNNEAAINSGIYKGTTTFGVMGGILNPYYKRISLELASWNVSNRREAERLEDVAVSIVNTVDKQIAHLYQHANMGPFMDAYLPGQPLNFQLTVSARMEALLRNANRINKEGVFNSGRFGTVTVISDNSTTLEDDTKGCCYLTMTNKDEGKNIYLTPGITGVVPASPTKPKPITLGQESINIITTIPVYEHIITTPCMVEFTYTVAGLDAVLATTTA